MRATLYPKEIIKFNIRKMKTSKTEKAMRNYPDLLFQYT